MNSMIDPDAGLLALGHELETAAYEEVPVHDIGRAYDRLRQILDGIDAMDAVTNAGRLVKVRAAAIEFGAA